MQKRKQFYFPVFLHPNHDPFHLNRSGPDFYAMNIGTFLRWESKMGAFYKIAIGIIVGNFWPVIDADQSVWCVCNDLLSNECRCISRWTIVRNTWPKLVYLNIVIKNSCRAKKEKIRNSLAKGIDVKCVRWGGFVARKIHRKAISNAHSIAASMVNYCLLSHSVPYDASAHRFAAHLWWLYDYLAANKSHRAKCLCSDYTHPRRRRRIHRTSFCTIFRFLLFLFIGCRCVNLRSPFRP